MKKKINIDNVNVYWDRCDWSPCMWRYEAVYENLPHPIGIMYVQHLGSGAIVNGKHIVKCSSNLMNIFVEKEYRRNGIARKILDVAMGHSNIIFTGVNGKIAEKTLFSCGFKFNKKENVYFCKNF